MFPLESGTKSVMARSPRLYGTREDCAGNLLVASEPHVAGALLHGKLDGELKRDPYEIEDLLTSVVIGTCSYLEPSRQPGDGHRFANELWGLKGRGELR